MMNLLPGGFKPERLSGGFWGSVADANAEIDRRQIVEDDMRRCGQFEYKGKYRKNPDGGWGDRETEYRCRILGVGDGTFTECGECGREVMVLVKGDIAEAPAVAEGGGGVGV